MQVADLQVIKDIPGFKVIFKAILKSQIQQMVSLMDWNKFRITCK